LSHCSNAMRSEINEDKEITSLESQLMRLNTTYNVCDSRLENWQNYSWPLLLPLPLAIATTAASPAVPQHDNSLLVYEIPTALHARP